MKKLNQLLLLKIVEESSMNLETASSNVGTMEKSVEADAIAEKYN